jgi:hypothetical protein
MSKFQTISHEARKTHISATPAASILLITTISCRRQDLSPESNPTRCPLLILIPSISNFTTIKAGQM